MPNTNANSNANADLVHSLEKLQTQIQDLRALVARSAPVEATAPAEPAEPGVKERLLAIVQAQRMVPLAELPELAGVTKSIAWYQTHELERQGAVWLRKTHAPSGHPRVEVYAAEAVATEARVTSPFTPAKTRG